MNFTMDFAQDRQGELAEFLSMLFAAFFMRLSVRKFVSVLWGIGRGRFGGRETSDDEPSP